jgi:cellulose synthase (UDP-forming)
MDPISPPILTQVPLSWSANPAPFHETPYHDRQVQRLRQGITLMLGFIFLTGVGVMGWFAGEQRIVQILSQIAHLLDHRPMWLEAPMVAGEYLIAPSVLLFLGAWGIMRLSPEPRTWSRWLVVGLLLALTLRYVLWRFTTLNLSNALNASFSVALLAMELLMLTGSIIQLVLLLRVRDRRPQADRYAQTVASGQYQPSVDVMVPTYNEAAFILRRTLIGAQAMDYPNKRIYLLDDTHRPEIRDLAADLGCEYLAREDNRHAKAGNLNHALGQTTGELVVVLDADFVPTTNFLSRTVGFFQNERIGLVQTPQSFYNPDPIASNLGLENVLTPEEEVFYRQIQPMRDGVGSVICAGTSFVVRRQALNQIGGFFTESLSEDYFTGIQIAASGYQVVYLDEKLSAGLAAENISAHATQRIRWAQGTLQAFFVSANPLTIRGLSWVQRLGHFEGLLHWFTSIPRIIFLIMPLVYSFVNVIPIRTTLPELLYFFLPYYLVQLTVFSWLNHRSRSALLSDIYTLVLVFPLALTLIRSLLKPFGRGFKVTPKGLGSDRFTFNWPLAWPLLGLFGLTAISLWRNLGMCMVKGNWATTVAPEVANQIKGLGLGWMWSVYNLMLLGIALLILLDVPRPDPYPWLDLRRVVRLRFGGAQGPEATVRWGVTTALSEVGAEVALTQGDLPTFVTDVFSPMNELATGKPVPVEVEIAEAALPLQAKLIQVGHDGEFPILRLAFEPLALPQQRLLVEMLFCRPGQWKRRRSPSELASLGLLFKVLLRPRFLERSVRVRSVAVVKG